MIRSSILSDGMVLQRGDKVNIWGKTDRAQTVKLSFLGKTYSAQTDSDGGWSVVLEDLVAGGPFEMVITAGEEQRVLRDILIGEVWVLGGQSNMELPVRRTLDLLADEIADVHLPWIRQFAVPQTYDFHGPRDPLTEGHWVSAVSEDVLDFSAAGFFFAKALYEKYNVPVGLILTAVGGTPVEAWISEPTLRRLGGYDVLLDQNKDDQFVTAVKKKDEQRSARWFERLNASDAGLREDWYRDDRAAGEWGTLTLPGSWAELGLESMRGAVWFRKEFDLPASLAPETEEAFLKLGTIVDADETFINGTRIGSTGYKYPPRRYPVPAGLLKPGKNTLAVRVISTQNTGEFIRDMPYELRVGGYKLDLTGAWEYRVGAVAGNLESQTFFQYMPAGVYNGMIHPLRNYRIRGVAWYQGESNTERPAGYHKLFRALVEDWRRLWGFDEFPFIFTQLANFGTDDGDAPANWPVLREEQRKSLEIPVTAMAVTIDIGEYNDLHPQDKKTLGQRLALCAAKIAYRDERIVHSGPLYAGMDRAGDTLRLHFDHVGGGLAIRGRDTELRGFSLRGTDGVFVPAQAEISGSTVVVRHESVPVPVHARYAWSNNPADANLVNREGLPASPFTTEE
ncbi:sialate O-acetylesterase [Paenibacillus sanfengchensis]|uniref:sialate O-acetylesterase n=1 Tax=Paenibacillus sanfengchensis TaxID=3119819 RepID=UPI002FE2E974